MSLTESMVRISRDRSALALPRARILIVEDEPLIAMDNQFTLESSGFETIAVAATAEDAIALAERERPDLVLMDVQLAGSSSGIDAAVQIFERCAVRVLFATAYVDRRTMDRGEHAHPLGWLNKPFNPHELVEAVELALQKINKAARL